MSEFNQASTDVVFKNDQHKEAVEDSSIDLFLHLSKEKHEKLIIAYNLVSGIRDAFEKQNEKDYTILRDKLVELRDESFPEESIETLSENAVKYRTFILRTFNLNFAKQLDEIANIGPFNTAFKVMAEGGEVDYKFIKPMPIKNNSPDLSKADRMRRRHRQSALQTTDTIAVTLTNSFIYTRIRRPTRLELVNLINRIEKELKYFGERWAISGLSLERAGISKILVEFFLELVVHHTVDDIDIKEELSSVILYNDIDAIAMGLLEAGAPKGVYYNLTCLADKCGYSTVRRYEASELYLALPQTLDEEQRAFLSSLPTAGRKFKIEEIRAYQNRYTHNGEVIDTSVKLYSEENPSTPYGEFNLGIPTISEYFNTFELMAELYNDAIQKYTLDYAADPAKLHRKRSELIGATRMGNYLHWIKNYVTYPDIGVEGDEGFTEDRSNGEQRQFEEGLLFIFNDDDEAYASTLDKINKCVPYMTHSVTGIYETQCPGCKKESQEEMAKTSGFTPIDPVTNFFDHTRTMIVRLGQSQQIEEVNIF